MKKTRAAVNISVTNDLPENAAPDQHEEWGGRKRAWRPTTVTETLELRVYDDMRWTYRIRIDGSVLTSKGNVHATQKDHAAVYDVPEWLVPHLRGRRELRNQLGAMIAKADEA